MDVEGAMLVREDVIDILMHLAKSFSARHRLGRAHVVKRVVPGPAAHEMNGERLNSPVGECWLEELQVLFAVMDEACIDLGQGRVFWLSRVFVNVEKVSGADAVLLVYFRL